jgi:hypothetical protein
MKARHHGIIRFADQSGSAAIAGMDVRTSRIARTLRMNLPRVSCHMPLVGRLPCSITEIDE